jgi:D-alanyl-lipoteichoic acid acyltransferase DltB (MBOAT superfamily)
VLFNTSAYFFFLLTVLALYFIVRRQTARVCVLLVASAAFYMYFVPAYILILLGVIIVDFSTANQIAKAKTRGNKKIWLLISILSNIGILFYFKYFNFFAETINAISSSHFNLLNIVLPIGLSFHTFQSLSYVVEVYKGNYPAEKNILVFTLYVLFFPQLVAGPIERPQNVLPQLHNLQDFKFENLVSGCRQIAIGLLLKSVLADRLSMYVSEVFEGNLTNRIETATGILFFSFQILCDFAGYSLVAIGSAKLLGVNLMKNFDQPYLSQSIREFWNRWHISLSTWFRDYLYIPLGGKSDSNLKLFRNILVVFVLSGLWHGANWNFVIWGLVHGILVFFSHIFKWKFSIISAPLKTIDILLNFILVSLLWVLFRARDLNQSVEIFERLIDNSAFWTNPFGRANTFGVFSVMTVVVISLYLFIEKKMNTQFEEKKLQFAQVFLITFSYVLVFALGVFQSQSFIYFQF